MTFDQKSPLLTVHFALIDSLVRDAQIDPGMTQDQLLLEAKLIKDVIQKLMSFRLDSTEFTCLKALCLFKPGKQDFRGKLGLFLQLFLKFRFGSSEATRSNRNDTRSNPHHVARVLPNELPA